MMKRVVLLILALLLMINLAEDGGLGKATFVVTPSSGKTSHTSPLQDYSGKVDSLYTLPSQGREISCLRPFQLVTLEVQPALKIVIATNTSSSGGIPL